MVDFTSLNTAATGIVTRFHTFAQNIETAHLGKIYSKTLDGLDYYVVELAAKPVLNKTPEWFTHNVAVNTIRSYQGLSIAVGVVLAVTSFISFIVWLHPKGSTSNRVGEGNGDPEGTGGAAPAASPRTGAPEGAGGNQNTTESDDDPDADRDDKKTVNSGTATVEAGGTTDDQRAAAIAAAQSEGLSTGVAGGTNGAGASGSISVDSVGVQATTNNGIRFDTVFAVDDAAASTGDNE